MFGTNLGNLQHPKY